MGAEAAVTGSLARSWPESHSGLSRSPDDVELDGPQPRRRAAMAVAVLVLMAAAGIGYALAVVNNETSGDAQTVSGRDGQGSDGAAAPTTALTDRDDSSIARPTELVVTPLPAMPVMATGVVVGDLIELEGVLPANPPPGWRSEVDDLADALGLTVVDSTEPAGRPAPGAELTLIYPGAVVFEEADSNQFDRSFPGSPEVLVDVLAPLLSRGSAELTITGYSDSSDPDGSSLAFVRAEHLVDLLGDRAVGPDRLTIETRPLAEATPDAQTEAVVGRRLDLVIVFGR